MEAPMPRKPRLHLPGGYYHVILRGNARQDIFFDEDDRQRWQCCIQKGIERHGHRVHVYCWMTNHVHLAIQAGTDPLSGFMTFLASQYARSTNRKMGRSGHLFERRYRAILVQEDSYLKELVRYIHLNPLRASMVSDLTDYPWSSHDAYLGGPCPEWLTLDRVLSQFGDTQKAARRRYNHFMNQIQPETMVQLFQQGGNDDDRVLGSDVWRDKVLKDPHSIPNLNNLDELVQRVCDRSGVTEADLSSKSRERKYARVRAEIALTATKHGIATVTTVARRFGRTQPGLSRTMSQLRNRRQ